MFHAYQQASQRSSHHRSNRLLGVETMEKRQLMTTTVFLDFDGATQAEVNQACGEHTCWSGRPDSGGLVGFEQGFSMLNRRAGQFPFLDFDGNNRLDRRDGVLATREVMNRVEQDFAPYDVDIVLSGNSRDAVQQMKESDSGDTLIFVNGGSSAVGGQAPLDVANRRDDIGAAGDTVGIADWIRDNYGASRSTAQDAFLNMTANFVSHEIGHTFGLEHLSESRSPEVDGRTLMDPFMWVNNVGFTDQYYWTGEGERQNEHRYMNDTIGASNDSWVAVLRPGQVTVRGASYNDSFSVTAAPGNDLQIRDRVNGRSYRTDVTSRPDISSLNQFNTPIFSISFRGGEGSDQFYADNTVNTRIVAFGQEGSDRIRGGAANDYLYGGDGNDILYGNDGHDNMSGGDGYDVLRGNSGNDTLRGGASHDFLFGEEGDDWLFGYDGNDYLAGGQGRDRLYGHSGNDTLNGGYDGERDLLYGGTGSDRLYDHVRLSFWYDPISRQFQRTMVSEDNLGDVAATDTVLRRAHFG